jgi:hypothetical protein
MASIRRTLTTLLKDHAASQESAMRSQQERQEEFEKEVREALARLETRREADRTTPRGGFDFEDAVTDFVTSAVRGAPCTCEHTGNIAGRINRCKKGDLVVRFTSESAFADASVVFESTRDASYTIQNALDELDAARANRNACAGVFVMSAE